MAARRIFSLLVDVSTGQVFDRDGGRVWQASDIPLVRADGNVFRFEFVYDKDSLTPYPLSSAQTFKFGVKNPSGITGTDFLAFADHADWNLAEDWAQVSLANGKVCCRVSTSTANMTSFLSSAGTTGAEAIAEVQVTEAGVEPFTPAQFAVLCKNDVIRGDEGSPSPSSPTYPTAAELNARLGSGIQLVRTPDGKVAVLLDGVEKATLG